MLIILLTIMLSAPLQATADMTCHVPSHTHDPESHDKPVYTLDHWFIHRSHAIMFDPESATFYFTRNGCRSAMIDSPSSNLPGTQSVRKSPDHTIPGLKKLPVKS